MNSILQLIEDRIRQFKEKRENLKQVKGTHEERHYVQGKLNELQFLKKKIKNHKFPDKCPHCHNNLSVLSSKIDLPNTSNLPAKDTPICWPYSQNQDKGTIESFQKLTIQVRCTSCGSYFNARYILDSFSEVTESAGIWYDPEPEIERFQQQLKQPDNKSENKFMKFLKRTRRRILEALNGHKF
jgi:hypothetical protein